VKKPRHSVCVANLNGMICTRAHMDVKQKVTFTKTEHNNAAVAR
jgi:hypothetical protein